MKRLLSICAAMALLFSCAESPEIEDDVTTPTPEEEVDGVPFSATITMPQSEETRISSDHGTDEWIFTWDEADKSGNVYAYCCYKDGDETKYTFRELKCEDLSDEASSADFSGSIPATTTNYRILYKSDNVKIGGSTDPTTVEDGSASIDLNLGANTTFDDSNLANLAMISDLRTLNESTDDVVLKHVGSFMVLDVSFTEVQEHWKEVEVEKITYKGKIPTVAEGISYWDANNPSVENLLSSADLNAQETEITYTPSEIIYADSLPSIKPLYFNILPMTFGDGAEATITISFSNGTKLVVTKTGSSDITFDRAEFNIFSVDYNSTVDDYPEDSDSSEYSTTTLKYYFNNGEFGTDEFDSYEISSEDHLAALAALANDGKITKGGCTFTLLNDIEITRDWWTPIGYKGYGIHDHHFAGTFDGDGHTISGYNTRTVDDRSDYSSTFVSLGLFGYATGTNTTVKNLKISDGNSDIGDKSACHVGILMGTLENGATILNCGCDSSCSATMGSRGAVGGLVGNVDNKLDKSEAVCCIYNSYNQGTIIGTANPDSGKGEINIGGICGASAESGVTIENCYNSGSVVTGANREEFYLGAIVGQGCYGTRATQNTYTNIYYSNVDLGVDFNDNGNTMIHKVGNYDHAQDSDIKFKDIHGVGDNAGDESWDYVLTELNNHENRSNIGGATWVAVDGYPTLEIFQD